MAYVGRKPVSGEIILFNSIESQFNGVLTEFTLQRTVNGTTQSYYAATTRQLLVSLGGVLQEPDTTGNQGFKISYDKIVFAVAPPAGTKCFIVSYGHIVDLGSPADGTVTVDKLSTGGPSWTTAGLLTTSALSVTNTTTTGALSVTNTTTTGSLTVNNSATIATNTVINSNTISTPPIQMNPIVVSANTTIPSSSNAQTIGPSVSINSNISVTVQGNWIIT